ncbi:uncharacterized protein N7500_005591 [Penicillium coprophilum]|uniref:uncharacterized protein n=1 Tax=Penicillium coprophilum TaxID=36646 RepID=UPI00239305F3|nr:uncharacterized protein N7500_005591 [Penicillium coprophilum]KAJ5163761.1 hypothetical protein N7500_005591 [Penicillium coprophilum]
MVVYTSNKTYPRASITPPIPPYAIQALQELEQLCIQDDLERFKQTLNSSYISHGFNIAYLSALMIQAIKLGRTCFVKELLRQKMLLSPLYIHEAIKTKENTKEILGSFLENGWDINQPMSRMDPPILSNALNDLEMTTWLLDHGADPNRRCSIDFTPLSCAVEHASLPVVCLLLNRGGDVTKGQVLHHAVARNSDTVEVLKLLIVRGAPINGIMYQDHRPSWDMYFFMGETSLHKAVYLRKTDVIRYLLEQGADPNIKDAGDQTVIQRADEEIQRVITEWS